MGEQLRQWRGCRSGDCGLHQLGDLLLHYGAPLVKRVRHRPHVALVQVRRVLEAQGRVALSELACVLEENDYLAVGVRVSGHPVPGLRRQHGGGRGDRDIAAALDANPSAGAFFDTLAQFYRNGYLRYIDATKRRPDLRTARIAEVTSLLASGIKERPRS